LESTCGYAARYAEADMPFRLRLGFSLGYALDYSARAQSDQIIRASGQSETDRTSGGAAAKKIGEKFLSSGAVSRHL
jgi:hypothetical protein